MIKLLLKVYLLLFPQCEMMVSLLTDFTHCNDSPAWAEHCYATSDWDYGVVRPTLPLAHFAALEAFVFKLPLVQTVSCWR